MDIKYEYRIDGEGISRIYYEGKNLEGIIDLKLEQDFELVPLGLITISFHAKLIETK